MKKLISLMATIILAVSAFGQTEEILYDSVLAHNLGADDYGMKFYCLVIRKTGTAEITDKQMRDSLFVGHMQNISRLAEQGKLVVAGPIAKNENEYRGIFILNVQSIEEAGSLVQTDPVINHNIMDADIYKWYGSAALPEYLKVHKLIEKHKP